MAIHAIETDGEQQSPKELFEDMHLTTAKTGLRCRPSFPARPTCRSRSLVVPANTPSAHPAWLHLTNLDRVMNPTFVSVVFFYEGVLSGRDGHKESFKTATTLLKESLAKVLIDFYPLAGRLTLCKETGRVDLQCNDAGAVFLEASMNETLAELGGPQPMYMISGMDSMSSFAGFGPGLRYMPDQINCAMPVLVLQVTEFTCGSIALAVNWHHSVADGFSGFHFMRSWAQTSVGQEVTLLPSYDRELLQPSTPLDSSMMENGSHSSPGTSESDSDSESDEELSNVEESHSELAEVSETSVKCFFLENEGVRQLKESLNGLTEVRESTVSAYGDGTGRPRFTSMESLSAELWKLMIKARMMDENKFPSADTSRFFTFVDGRKRMGLPPGYFGNVVCSVCAESNPDELLRNPLSYAAELIRTAVRGVNKEYFRSIIDWVQERELTSSNDTKSNYANSVNTNDVVATFWSSFPLYEVNFGWGKPVLSVSNAPPRKLVNGIAMMPGPDKSGRIVALINLNANRMQKFQQDGNFLRLGARVTTKNVHPQLFKFHSL